MQRVQQFTPEVSDPQIQNSDDVEQHVLTVGSMTNMYITKGKSPKILIMTSVHGDEAETGECVEAVLKQMNASLPDYLYIPVACPSAVLEGTRKSKEGNDLNRSFSNNTKVPEALWIMHVLKGRTFDVCISLHEDPEYSQFYVYDAYGQNMEGTKQLSLLRSQITALGVPLLNGVDDDNDPTLGDIFYEGYRYYPKVVGKENPYGFFERWAFTHGILKRYVNPEIPGKLPMQKKMEMVTVLLNHFVKNQ